MTFLKRLRAAWRILCGKSTEGPPVQPQSLEGGPIKPTPPP